MPRHDALWMFMIAYGAGDFEFVARKHSAHEVVQAFLANWSLLALYNHDYSWLNMVTPVFHGCHKLSQLHPRHFHSKNSRPPTSFSTCRSLQSDPATPWLWALCDFPMALVGVYTWDLISYRYWSGIEFQTGLNCTKYRSNLGLHRFNVPLWGLDLTLNYTVNNIYGIMWV